MRRSKFQILLVAILSLLVLSGCKTQIDKQQTSAISDTSNVHHVNLKLERPLQIGDKIELSGGYDYDPIYLKNPPATNRKGTVIQFIKGQNEDTAAIVKLDHKISGEKVVGDIVVLELRYVGQTWQDPTPVHIELCDFMPKDKAWKDRKHGEWVEAAASLKIIK